MNATQVLFGCDNVKDVKIPEGGNVNFFNPEENKTTKIRFLKGPKMYYLHQEWSDDRKPIGDKKYYAEGDKTMPNDARLNFSYIIYNYTDEQIQTWDVSVKGLLKAIKAINDLNPQLSAFDCNVSKKKGSNGFMEYTLVNGAPAPFENQEVIDQFIEEKPFEKMVEAIDNKIEETKNGWSLEDEEKAIEAEIAAKKAAAPEVKADAPVETPAAKTESDAPATAADAEAAFK